MSLPTKMPTTEAPKTKRRPIMTKEMLEMMEEADARLRARGIEPGDNPPAGEED